MVSHKMNTFFHAIGTASFSLAVASATLAAPVWETDFNKDWRQPGPKTVP